MKRTAYASKKRQLKNLTSNLEELLNRGILKNDGRVQVLLSKIKRLFEQLKSVVPSFELRKLAGAALLLLGLTASTSIHAQNFSPPVANPFGLTNAFQYAFTELQDMDNDGDFDLIVGEYYGATKYYENGGTATAPAFLPPVQDPWGLDSLYYVALPTSADLDGDGDNDLMFGDGSGDLIYYENTGTASVPNFTNAPILNPFGSTAVAGGYFAAPSFVDMDNDGDFDLIVGDGVYSYSSYSYSMDFLYYKNSGTATAPAFDPPVANPFGMIAANNFAFPKMMDIDSDGDFDLVYGEYNGDIGFQENTGTAAAPAFGTPMTNPFNLIALPDFSSPAGADLDNDGDLDLMVGQYYYNQTTYTYDGRLNYFENSPALQTPMIVSTTPADNSVNVVPSPTASLSLVFDLPCIMGTGNVTVKNLTDATQQIIPVANTNIGGASILIPNVNLLPSKDYAVQIDPTAYTSAGVNCIGIGDDTTWNFNTGFPVGLNDFDASAFEMTLLENSSLLINSPKSTQASLEILNLNGQLLSRKELEILEGKSVYSIEKPAVSGVYLIRLNSGNFSKSLKFVVH